MKYLPVIVVLHVLSCNTITAYPEAGFDYPGSVAGSDTSLYFYQLRHIREKRKAFSDAYAYLFYQPFDEPNLSIKPQSNETFRLTYSPAFGPALIIILTENQMIVKEGDPSVIYKSDTSQLEPIEASHLRFLQRRYPVDTTPRLKKYLDSITKIHPQLLDPAYYHTIYKKTIALSGAAFSYTKKSD